MNEFYQNDMVRIAEIHRELGEFDAALKVLETITLDEYSDVVRQFRVLCESRDPRVRELDFDA